MRECVSLNTLVSLCVFPLLLLCCFLSCFQLFSFLWLLPAYWLICMGQDQIDPGIASILMLFEVVIGIVSAYFLANEIITARELIGGIFVLSAPLIELRSPKK